MLKSCFADLLPFAVRNLLSFFLCQIKSAAAEGCWAELLAVLALDFALVVLLVVGVALV